MLTPGGWVLIDWDTALAAPPERDLWSLDPGDGSILDAYAGLTGVTPQSAMLDLYRLRWDIADIAADVSRFRRPHARDRRGRRVFRVPEFPGQAGQRRDPGRQVGPPVSRGLGHRPLVRLGCPAQHGAQQCLRRVGGGPRGDRVGVGPVEVAERDAVERHLGVVHGQLELTGSLVEADRLLVAGRDPHLLLVTAWDAHGRLPPDPDPLHLWPGGARRRRVPPSQ